MSTPPLGTRARSSELDANGIRQHCLDYGGDGPPLLIVAGITMPAACVEFLALPLAERHRVISVDPTRAWLSEQPASGYALTDYADDLAGADRGYRARAADRASDTRWGPHRRRAGRLPPGGGGLG